MGTPTADRLCAMRVVHDSQAGVVLVYEPETKDAAERALLFESGEWSARVDRYPAEWRKLSDEELMALGRVER